MLRLDLGSGMNAPIDSPPPVFTPALDSGRNVVEIPLGELADDRAAYKTLIGRHLLPSCVDVDSRWGFPRGG